MDELGLVLLNEPASNTRIGQGACRDTSPDLSIWSDAGAITWSNTFEDLESDQRVLSMTMGEDKNKMDGCQKARVVDWDKFREQREREKQEGRSRISGMVQGTTRGCRKSYKRNRMTRRVKRT
ncbi:hypothetical protein MRX96_010570 [Rhipicephalus microplus]